MHAAFDTRAPAMSSSAISVLLVDDQPAVRYGLQLLFELETETLQVWEAGSSAEALALVKHTRPDVVIMDVDLPDHSGILTTQHLKVLLPRCLVIMLTIHNRPEVRSRALEAGAWAFVEKGKPEEICTTLQRAIQCLQGKPTATALNTRLP